MGYFKEGPPSLRIAGSEVGTWPRSAWRLSVPSHHLLSEHSTNRALEGLGMHQHTFGSKIIRSSHPNPFPINLLLEKALRDLSRYADHFLEKKKLKFLLLFVKKGA